MEQLERLNDDELMEDPEKADAEIKRAKSITEIGKVIVDNSNTILKAQMHVNHMHAEYGQKYGGAPSILLENKGDKQGGEKNE